MPQFDTVIKNGTVFDGQRTPRFNGDIGIKDGHVVSIGGKIHSSDAGKVIDATGLNVAPGFIDLHTHYDSQVYWDPWCSISSWHGVTSVAIGNCGFGFAPCKPEDQDRAMLTMSRNEAVPLESMQEGMPWDWETYPEFLDSLDRTPKGVNMLSYMPLNPLMAYVMGLEAAKSRPANEAEMAEMHRLMKEGLEAGGCGWSAQIGENDIQRDYDGTLMITNLMTHDDLLSFARVLREVGRGFIQCIGASQELTEKLADESGRPVIYNVLGVATDQHGAAMPQYKDTIKWLDDCNARGTRVFAQALTAENNFQFTFEEWNLFDSSPVWREMTLGTVEERAVKMADPERRAAAKAEFDDSQYGGVGIVFSLDQLIVGELHKPELDHYTGWTVTEIAKDRDCHPVDAMLDIALEDDMKALFVTAPRPTDMAAMKEVANSAFALPGVSDGGAHTKFITLGRYPTEFLTSLVRDNEVMDLEQAHWRLSAYPALAAGFRDRGTIREGAPADIVIYDLEKLEMGETEKAYDYPAGAWRLVRKPEGYRHILVNGEETFVDGECTGATTGKLLRHGSA
ncbi:MAG: amidohydrolase family protein [Dehalococcoidia bacterium]|nr:amidohydrolase family protein [Dehalococcoidia bacterium]MYI86257.1 amidohydrolase family protein [Dehalococcoidia bacterium]